MTLPREVTTICSGGFGTLRRSIAFFISQQTVIAFCLRTQVEDMRKAPNLELRVAEPIARRPVSETSNLVREIRQLRPRGLDHPGRAKAPGDDVRDEVGNLNARGEVAVRVPTTFV